MMDSSGNIYDVVIIGAGPCGLAVASRLCEQTPSALFTDAEHQRFWRRFGYKTTLEAERRNKRRHSNDSNDSAGPSQRYDMLVLDAEGDSWLKYWKTKFSDLEIQYCRSPMFFHVDPQDRDSLLGFVDRQDEANLHRQEIGGVVGKELSKHRLKKKNQRRQKPTPVHLEIDERDRNDYYTPSSQAFAAHCSQVVDRYGLSEMIRQDRVELIEQIDLPQFRDKIFRLKTGSGTEYMAKVVVLAVGAGREASLPPDCPLDCGSFGHCLRENGCRIPPHVRTKISHRRETNVVVIGGGLTAAQIADLYLRKGVSRVWMLLRGRYKVKHFDVDLEWVAKTRNQRMSAFWMLDDDDDRLEMLTKAKDGGSITPRFSRILQRHTLNSRLYIHQNTKLVDGTWCPESKTWSLTTTSDLDLPSIDHVIWATGLPSDFSTLPFVQSLMQENPIPCKGGMPCVTNDLMWNEDVPCLVTGRFAGLRLGPGAANLMGARQGAERVAWKIEQLLGKANRDDRANTEELKCYISGLSNQYGILSLQDE